MSGVLYSMVDKLLKKLNIILDLKSVQEIRLRKDLPIKYLERGVYKTYKKGGVEAIATKELIEQVVAIVTENSYYAFEQSFAKGFLNYHGAKISLCGRCVIDRGELSGIRDITSINIRIPRCVDCIPEDIAKNIYENAESVLIIGKVCSGKTTLLRSMTAKCPYPITVADEKGELMLTSDSLGENADVISYATKDIALELAVKGLTPRYIAFDEVTDIDVVKRAKNFGISVIATMFGDEVDILLKKVKGLFDKVIVTKCEDGCFTKSIVKVP